MPDKKLPISEFAAKLKVKYPEYKDFNDTDLVIRVTTKYPQYKDVVDLSGLSKKKEVSEPSLPTGGKVGISEAPSEEGGAISKAISKGIATALQQPKVKQAIEGKQREDVLSFLQQEKAKAPTKITGPTPTMPTEGVILPAKSLKKVETSFALPKEKIDNIVVPTFQEVASSADPLGAIEQKESEEKDLQRKADLMAVSTLVKEQIPNFYQAFKAAQSPLPDTRTNQLTKERAANYESATRGLREIKAPDLMTANNLFIESNIIPQIERAAVMYHINKYPSFQEELDAVNTSVDNPNLPNALGSAKMGQIMQEFLYSPEVIAFENQEDSNIGAAIQRAREVNLSRNTMWGVSVVGNKVSQAFERSPYRRNAIAGFDTPALRSDLNTVATQVLTPEEYKIYDLYIKGNEDKYLDVPSFFERFARGGEGVFKGVYNTLSKITGYGKSTEEIVRENWEKEALNVTANPEGLRGFLAGSGNVLGLVAAIGGTGRVSTPIIGSAAAGTGLPAATTTSIADAVNVSTAFLGDMLDEGTIKYPDNPVKAYTSGIFNTAAFVAMGRSIFPLKNVQSVFNKAKPEIDQVVRNLTNGSITREAAKKELNTIVKKGVDVLGAGLAQNVKVSAELTALQGANEILDIALGMDPDKLSKYYPKGTYGESFKHLFLSNALVSSIAGYGKVKQKNAIARESIYEAASNPKRYSNIIEQSAVKDPTLNKQELLDNLAFSVEVKRLLDQRGVPVEKQKDYLILALGERVALAEKAKIQDSTLRKEVENKISEAQKEKAAILTAPEEVVAEEPVAPEVPAAPKKPTEEQQIKDIQEGNLVTFTYENELQVPETLKDKISSRGEINGKPYVRVTIAKSLADYELGKAEGVGEVTPKAAPELPAAPEVSEELSMGENRIPVKREVYRLTNEDGEIVDYKVTTNLDGTARNWEMRVEGEKEFGDTKVKFNKVQDFIDVFGKDNKIEKIQEEGYEKVMNPKLFERLTEEQKERVRAAQAAKPEAAPEVPKAPVEEMEDMPELGEVRPETPSEPPAFEGYKPIEFAEAFEVEEKPKAKEVKAETDIRKRALNLDVEGVPRGEVLQYFIGGGKISSDAIKKLFQRSENRIRWNVMKPEERKSRIGLTSKKGPTIEELAEKLAGADRLDMTQEFRNIIEEVVLENYGTKSMERELVESYDAEYKMMMREQELMELGEEMERQIQEFTAGLPEAQKREIAEVLNEIRNNDGTIDWDTIEREMQSAELSSSPIIQKLSPETQNIIIDGIKQLNETGRVSRVPVEAVPSAEARRAGDFLRKAADATRKGKISKLGGFRAGTGYDAVWDASLEVIAKALEGGATVVDAIDQGLKYVKSTGWYKKLSDPKDFDKKYREHLKSQYDALQVEAAGEVPVQPEARVSGKVEAGVPPTGPKKVTEKGEVENQTAAEKKSVELSIKGINEVANEFSIETYEGRPRKTDVELREAAKAKIDKWVAEGSYDKNIESLIKKAEDLEVLTDEQRVIMEQHLASVRQQFADGLKNNTIKPGSKEFNDGLNRIKRLIDAAGSARSAAGAALRVPTGGSYAHPLENYDTALMAKMEANRVDKLTEEQIREVERDVNDYKAKLEIANTKIKDLEDKLAQMMAEEEVSETKKRRVVKSREDRIAERKQAISDAREALKRLRSGAEGLSAVPLPFVREFIAISPYVKKVMASYVGEGIDNLNLLIDKIYDDFKDAVPEITKKDIRDIIGNQYTERKETKSELSKKLRDLTEEARLLSIYEKELAGEQPKTEKKRIQKNKKLTDLRNQINELRKNNREVDVIDPDLKKIKDAKNRALAKAKEYKERLDNKDFAVKEKPVSIFSDTKLQKKYPKEYNEMLDAIQAKEDAKHEFEIELMKAEEKNQTALQKFGRAGKMIVGTTKAIKSGIDASATFIQNFPALFKYPSSWGKAFVNMWGDMASQKRFNRWLTALKNNKPVWDLMQKSGLSITEPAALKEAQKEEIFSNNLLDRNFKIGKKSYNIGKYFTKPFERLFVSMGNGIRVDAFLKVAEKWYEEGKTFETNPEDFKALANAINNSTGRANLPPAMERARDIIGAGIWSPQLMATRFNILGISDVVSPFFGRKGYYAGLTPEVRKAEIAGTAKMIGFGLSMMLLAYWSGADDVDFDPTSPTFGTVRIGNKRIPMFSNFTKYVRSIVQLALGVQKVEGEYKPKGRGETVVRFFRSSTPPATGTLVDVITGKDYMGRPVTAEGVVKNLAYPISMEAIGKELRRDGALGAISGLAQFFGWNISDERDYVKREDKPFEVKDPSTFKKREATAAEMEQFKKRRDEIYEEMADEYEKNNVSLFIDLEGKVKLSSGSASQEEFDQWKELYFNELNRDQVKELYKLIMKKASKQAKNDLELEVEEEKEE
jgi:hypothetical protein